MQPAKAAVLLCKKMLKFGLSLFGRGFKSSKCKTMAKLVTARIKLLRNKREAVVRQMRRDVALLLQSGQEATARIRVEHVIREQNIMAANEIIELFCELIVARLSIIAKQRECPADLKEGISSLIFSAPRCADIPELLQLRTIFEKKYGKEFVNAATELRPDCGVNRMLVDKLSVRTPTGEVKLKVMKEIAKEHLIAWDHTETENELLTPPEDLIEGPRRFVSAASMPLKSSQGGETNQHANRGHGMNFKDTASAARVAAESAEKAVAAAQAAARLANRDISSSHREHPERSYESHSYDRSGSTSYSMSDDRPIDSQDRVDAPVEDEPSWRRYEYHTSPPRPNRIPVNSQDLDFPGRTYESHSPDSKRNYRRHSYTAPAAHSGIKFDESDGPDSDCDEEIEMETLPGPPDRSPPPVPPTHRRNSLPRVHPKLPDYEDLSTRFEALKSRKYP